MAPSDLMGTVQVAVKNADGASDPVTVNVDPVLLINGVATTLAKPGETIVLYGTGFGPTSPNVTAGEVYGGAASLASAPGIRVGSTYADLQFAGLTGAGLYQFNIVVPNVPDGDHDVVATAGGVRPQPLVRLRVQR